MITYHSPSQGPSIGGTKVKVLGVGFTPFIPQVEGKAASPPNRLWVRWVNSVSGDIISPSKEIFGYSSD